MGMGGMGGMPGMPGMPPGMGSGDPAQVFFASSKQLCLTMLCEPHRLMYGALRRVLLRIFNDVI